MGSAKAFVTLLLLLSLGIASITAQKLYSRSLMDGNKNPETVLTRNINLRILSQKNNIPLWGVRVQVNGVELIHNTDETGTINFEVRMEPNQQKIELGFHKNRYFDKTISISLDNDGNIKKTIHLKFDPKSPCFKTIITPSF